MSPAELSNEDLTTRLRQLLGEERCIQVEFLLHLAELDRRQEWRRLGYANLWQYCERELKLRENAIFVRTTVVKLMHRFPAAVDCLRDGRLSMSSLVELKDVLTAENLGELLELAGGKSKREVEALVASRRALVAAPLTKASIRALPPALPVAPQTETPVLSFEAPQPHPHPSQAPAVPLLSPAEPPRPEPRFEIKLVVSRQFVEALEHARLALSHSVPRGDTVGVLQHCLERLLAIEEERHPRSNIGRRRIDHRC